MKNIYTIKKTAVNIFIFSFLLFSFAKANVTVTPAGSGTCLNVSPGAYMAIGTITISEGNNGDFASPQTNTTLILTAPANFQFNPGIGTVSYTGGRNITAASITITATTITVTLSVSGTNRSDNLMISNVQARATLSGVSGQILRTGGTASIAGDATGGGVNHGTLATAGGSFTTAAAGSWTSTSTWVGGIVPGCNADVTIFHAVTVGSSPTVNNLTINTSGSIGAFSAITVNGTFTINGTGTYTHNTTSNASTNIFKGTENFSSTSNLIINNWYNGNFPLGTYVSGDFGNVTMNINGVWDQDGQFAPNRIKGSFTVSRGEVIMDDGTGMTTSLTLQNVLITGTANLLMASGPNRNLTLITNNFTDNSTSPYVTAFMFYSYGTLNWTCNGNFNVSHDFSGIQGTGADNALGIVTITGDLNISGGLFDFNYLVNGALTLTVNGNTTVNCTSSDWSHLIESNSESLTYTTTNLYLSGSCTNNYLQGSTGSATINILNDFISSGSDVFSFTSQSNNTAAANITIGNDFNCTSGTVNLGYSTQNINCTIARDMIINGASANISGQSYNSGTSSTTITVGRDLSITSGTFEQSYNKGNITLNVNRTLDVNSGNFRGIDHPVTGNWGIATFNINSIDFDGGNMFLFDGRINDGRTITVNITEDFDMNFSSAADRVILIRGATANNATLDFNVGGNLNVAGSTAGCFFLTNYGSGNEQVDISGSINISGSETYFAGNVAAGGNAHDITANIDGSINVSGGTLVLSSQGGTADITVNADVNVTGGTAITKWDTGITNFIVNGNYDQTAGTFYLHGRNNPTADTINMTVYGDFSLAGGAFYFDNHQGNATAEHNLYIAGPSFNFGGSSIIAHANNSTGNTVFGQLHFNNIGTTVYNRSSSSADIQQVKQTIHAATTINASTSASDFIIGSHVSNNAADHTTLTVDGTMRMGFREISAHQQNNYNAQINVNAGGRIRTRHTGGFYSGSASASCINSMINGNNNVNYSLDATGIIEYYGDNNQVITGIPNGLATATQHKYGILEINFAGTANAEYVSPEASDEVFVRTNLVLTNGELNLDSDHNPSNGGGKTINIENGATISRTSGYIRSETEDGSGVIKWNITSTGSFEFPFGYNSIEYIPFIFAPTLGSAGDVTIGTYHTLVNNVTYPAGVTHVHDLFGYDNSAYTVDRFWNITVIGNPVVDMTFTATAAEIGTITSPRMQRWIPAIHGWEPAQGVQSNPTSFTTYGSGITGIGVWWTLSSSSSPLPVQLTSFNASCEGKYVTVKWSTASELNCNYFLVEKSLDNQSFYSIGKIKGAGTSSSMHNYFFNDVEIASKTSYYRLKQVDFNENKYTSSIIPVEFCAGFTSLSIASVQFNDNNCEVKIYSASEDEIHLFLFDNNGQLINKRIEHVNSGINSFILNNTCSKSVYLITVNNTSDMITKKAFSGKQY